MSDFLPAGTEVPVAPSQFMKIEEGKNKFRVLDNAVVGVEFWTEEKLEDGSIKKTPNRVHKGESIPVEKLAEDNLPKDFWAFPVWNYATQSVQTFQVTQKTIMKALKNYVEDEDYGDPRGYDIEITRSGKGKETEYAVVAKPPKEFDTKVIAQFNGLKLAGAYDINRLYDGEYPLDAKKANAGVSDATV